MAFPSGRVDKKEKPTPPPAIRGPHMLRKTYVEEPSVRLPEPPAPAITPQSFVLCAMNCFPGQSPQLWAEQQALYQIAFEKAQAVARPSILERDLLGYWN